VTPSLGSYLSVVCKIQTPSQTFGRGTTNGAVAAFPDTKTGVTFSEICINRLSISLL
jgi:hypothetical protein